MTTDRKIVISVAVVAAVALFFLGRCNGIRSVTKTAGTVVTVTKDSIVYQDRPVPYRVDSLIPGKDGKTVYIYDTLLGPPEVRIEPADTAKILAAFYETAYYQHKVDTGRWQITVDESVTQNRIKDWSLKAVSTDTNTVTTMILRPPRNIVGYFTLSAMGNFKYPGAGVGAGFALKLPNDRFYQAELKLVKDHKPMAEIRIGMPLRSKHN